ncbi:Thioredoxin domain-containing protein 9 homolog [Linum grandiflorum]
MADSIVQDILEKQVLSVVKAVEDKIDDEIAALDRLDTDDLEALRERRMQQMKKMAEKRRRWMSLGHGDYTEIQAEKDFFSVVKASDRVVCHFYRENWPCKILLLPRDTYRLLRCLHLHKFNIIIGLIFTCVSVDS